MGVGWVEARSEEGEGRRLLARCRTLKSGVQGVAQLGRARGLGPRGRRFESYHPDLLFGQSLCKSPDSGGA